MFSSLIDIPMLLMRAVAVLLALSLHEFAHGFVSSKLGDPTPRLTGRLTVNPLAHLDPIGAVLMLITGFGWAKPVQIDARYYKNPKRGMAMTAAAGPLMNLILAFLAMLLYTASWIAAYKLNLWDNTLITFVQNFMYVFATMNLCFLVFNIIPIPPLDGSRVLGLFLSDRAYFKLQQFERYSFLLIIVLSLGGFFGSYIGGGVELFMSIILRVCNSIANMVI